MIYEIIMVLVFIMVIGVMDWALLIAKKHDPVKERIKNGTMIYDKK